MPGVRRTASRSCCSMVFPMIHVRSTKAAALLAADGMRCYAPYLRGFGPTRFFSFRPKPCRSGQQTAIADDARAPCSMRWVSRRRWWPDSTGAGGQPSFVRRFGRSASSGCWSSAAISSRDLARSNKASACRHRASDPASIFHRFGARAAPLAERPAGHLPASAPAMVAWSGRRGVVRRDIRVLRQSRFRRGELAQLCAPYRRSQR